jgi:hypothetical protein
MRIRSTYQQSAFNYRGGCTSEAFEDASLADDLEADEALFDDLTAYQDIPLFSEPQENGFLILDAEPIGFPDMPLEPPVWPYAKKKGTERVYRVRGTGLFDPVDNLYDDGRM